MSRKRLIRRLLQVVPKDRIKAARDIRRITAEIAAQNTDAIEITAKEDQYNVQFHGIFRDKSNGRGY